MCKYKSQLGRIKEYTYNPEDNKRKHQTSLGHIRSYGCKQLFETTILSGECDGFPGHTTRAKKPQRTQGILS